MQDIKKYIGIEENLIKDNYPKLKDYILKVFDKVSKLVISIKEEPYIIKNCLYLLTEVETIPAYIEQCEELEEHITKLKAQFTTQDMQTILDRQLTILGSKKKNESLPPRPE